MTLSKKQFLSLILILVLLFALPVAIFLTRKKQDIRPQASFVGRANIMMNSDLMSTNVGQSFNVLITLQLTDPRLKVSAMDFLVLYDKAKLDVVNIIPALTSIDPKAPFTDANIVTSGGNFDDTFNFVRVAEYARKYNADLKGGTFNVAKIIFRARGEGKAAIKMPDDNKYIEIVGIGSSI